MKKRSYRQVVAAVCATPWAILPEKLRAISDLISLRNSGVRLSREDIQARIGPRRAVPSASQAAGPTQVAVLELYGVISPRMSAMTDISGGTSAEAFGKAFDRAMADDSVSAIVFDVDSPGGSTALIQETAAKIYAARGKKPIIAVASGAMASAAYWLGSAADQIVATPSAESIGSIGVLVTHMDDSEADAQAGIKRTVIASTAEKIELDGPLSDSAREFIQSKIDGMYSVFLADVGRNRGISAAAVRANYGKGRSFLAKDALSMGMIDRIATLEQVLSEFGVSGGSTGRTQAAANPSIVLEGKTTMKFSAKLMTRLVRLGACNFDTPEEQVLPMLHGWMSAKGLPPLDGTTEEAIFKALEDKAADQSAQPSQQAAPTQQAAQQPTQQPAAGVGAGVGAIPGVNARGADGVPHEDMVSVVQLAGGLTAEQRIELIADMGPKCSSLTLKAINAAIAEKQKAASAKQPTGATIPHGGGAGGSNGGGGGGGSGVQASTAERDKFHAHARDSILLRTWAGTLPPKIFSVAEQDYLDWKPNRRMSGGLATLPRLAEACLMAAGIPYMELSGLAPSAIARLVMGARPSDVGLRADVGDMMYNVSGMFTNVLVDAAHVMLRRSYDEVDTTFQLWAKQGTSVTDFRDQNKALLGELSDPKAVPEDGEFEEQTVSDSKEKYHVSVWGAIFSISWQTVVNDQLGAFTEIPSKQGRSMRRKQNKLVYGVLNDNAKLADGIALFDTNSLATPGHNNLAGAAAVVSVASLNLANARMAKMTGLNTASNTVLNIQPKFILYPPDIDGTVKSVLQSTSDPQAGGSNPGNANSTNVWRNRLTPIQEAQLSAVGGGSDTAWYLAADSADVDTVEYAYLQGLETPALESAMSFERLGMKFRIYQPFVAKAIDFRGLQKNAGA